MIMDELSSQLGMSIIGDKLRMIEAQKLANGIQVTAAVDTILSVPFEFTAIGNNKYLPIFADVINSLCQRKSIQAKKVHLALEKRLTISKRILVDKDLSESALQQHVEWELEQLLISPRDEYNADFELIKTGDEQRSNMVFIVAVRKAIINYLKEIFIRTSLDFATLDIDLLAAIRGLDFSSSFNLGPIALVDFSIRGVDCCLVRANKYLISSEFSYPKTSTLEQPGSQDIAAKTMEELTKLFHEINTPLNRMEKIIITGDRFDPAVIPQLQELNRSCTVEVANPLKNVLLSVDRESEGQIQKHPERFLVSMGMVLGDTKL